MRCTYVSLLVSAAAPAPYGAQLPLAPISSFATSILPFPTRPSIAPSGGSLSQGAISNPPIALTSFPDASNPCLDIHDLIDEHCVNRERVQHGRWNFHFEIFAYLKSWYRNTWQSWYTSTTAGACWKKSDPIPKHNIQQEVWDTVAHGVETLSRDGSTDDRLDQDDWEYDELAVDEIPQYVLDYAPYVHLYSGEQFWPCDMVDHLKHTTPHLNYTPLQAESDHPNLTDLNQLNHWGRFVYLTSDDNVEERPGWLGGRSNIPSLKRRLDKEGVESTSDGNDEQPMGVAPAGSVDQAAQQRAIPRRAKQHTEALARFAPLGTIQEIPANSIGPRWKCGRRETSGRSDAPAVLIVIDKGNGTVDAFWFFFYCFNLGNTVLNVRFGNHVGDWEHTMVRFQNGTPEAVWLSEHNSGEAYTYDAVEKIGKRPVVYSAVGTHAMYATPGSHPYVLPWGLLRDRTDRGPLWDPALNSHTYTYDLPSHTLTASNYTPQAPTGWFDFFGFWGDKMYPLSDPRQYRVAGQYHYVGGPLGPKFKDIGRTQVCPGRGPCDIKGSLDEDQDPRRWQEFDGEEQTSEDDARLFLPPDEIL